MEKSAREVIREAFAEALRQDPQKARRWVVLVDGEPKQLRVVKAEARRAGVKVTILADIVHCSSTCGQRRALSSAIVERINDAIDEIRSLLERLLPETVLVLILGILGRRRVV